MHLMRRTLSDLARPNAFAWLAGIEDTFITAPSPKTGRTLDEYELTEHYARWRDDLDLFAELGLKTVRYGIPWHRVNPSPGAWDFTWLDGPLERLLELGIQPIVDLVHYGVPAWIDGAYLHPDYDRFVAEYAARVAERFKGRIRAYTPLNEPRIAGWYCGRLGWWPPARRGWRGFVSVMIAVCRGIVRTVEAQRAIDPEIVHAHVDATDLYEADSPDLSAEALRRQAIVFLALDLITGRVNAEHELRSWLLANGATSSDLDWFGAHAIELDLVGINLYPLFSRKRLVRAAGKLRIQMPYADATIVDTLAEMYWLRYGRPVFISETASSGAVRRRLAWLNDSVEAVRRARAQGVPLVGYTWWPLFALVTWGYREGRKATHEYLKQMGLWDLRSDDGALERVRTLLVDRYRDLVATGANRIGPIAQLNGA